MLGLRRILTILLGSTPLPDWLLALSFSMQLKAGAGGTRPLPSHWSLLSTQQRSRTDLQWSLERSVLGLIADVEQMLQHGGEYFCVFFLKPILFSPISIYLLYPDMENKYTGWSPTQLFRVDNGFPHSTSATMWQCWTSHKAWEKRASHMLTHSQQCWVFHIPPGGWTEQCRSESTWGCGGGRKSSDGNYF